MRAKPLSLRQWKRGSISRHNDASGHYGLTARASGCKTAAYMLSKELEISMKKPLLLFLMTCLCIGIIGHLVIAFVITG